MAPLSRTTVAFPAAATTTTIAPAKAEVKHRSLFSTTNLVLGGTAATFITAGGIIGKMKGHGLAGLGIGAALATAAVGAALLGGASSSYYYDPYPSTPYYPSTPGNGGWGGGTPNSP
ncbi:MAG: hypothetical protein JWM98_67, partial [Thermoleophilia bacterium]|nr:hypothetical protein [Thermoleophilia bacterium]